MVVFLYPVLVGYVLKQCYWNRICLKRQHAQGSIEALRFCYPYSDVFIRDCSI